MKTPVSFYKQSLLCLLAVWMLRSTTTFTGSSMAVEGLPSRSIHPPRAAPSPPHENDDSLRNTDTAVNIRDSSLSSSRTGLVEVSTYLDHHSRVVDAPAPDDPVLPPSPLAQPGGENDQPPREEVIFKRINRNDNYRRNLDAAADNDRKKPDTLEPTMMMGKKTKKKDKKM